VGKKDRELEGDGGAHEPRYSRTSGFERAAHSGMTPGITRLEFGIDKKRRAPHSTENAMDMPRISIVAKKENISASKIPSRYGQSGPTSLFVILVAGGRRVLDRTGESDSRSTRECRPRVLNDEREVSSSKEPTGRNRLLAETKTSGRVEITGEWRAERQTKRSSAANLDVNKKV